MVPDIAEEMAQSACRGIQAEGRTGKAPFEANGPVNET